VRDIVRLAILTGQRNKEVAGMEIGSQRLALRRHAGHPSPPHEAEK
jgi:hypothetical protein